MAEVYVQVVIGSALSQAPEVVAVVGLASSMGPPPCSSALLVAAHWFVAPCKSPLYLNHYLALK